MATKPIIRIHNMETDEVIDREMTDAEYAEHLLQRKENAIVMQKREQEAANKAAILEKLGITAEEAKILLT